MVRDITVRISYLFHRKQILLVNFCHVIYFVDSNDLYNLERLLLSFNLVSIWTQYIEYGPS